MMSKNSMPTEKERAKILEKRNLRINNYRSHTITPSEFSNKTKQQFLKLHEGLLYLLLLDSTGSYHDDGEIIANLQAINKLVYWDEIGIDNDSGRTKHPLGKLLKADDKSFEYSIEPQKLIEWAREPTY